MTIGTVSAHLSEALRDPDPRALPGTGASGPLGVQPAVVEGPTRTNPLSVADDEHGPWSTSRGPDPGRAPALRRTGLGDGDEIDASSCADPTPSPTRARAYPVHGGWP